MLSSLKKAGITEWILVIGYQKEKIEQFVQRHGHETGRIRFRLNPDFKKGSILSLWSVRDELDGDLLIMDADVLFSDALLLKLVQSRHPNALLLDPRSASTGEEMMLMARGDRVVHISRRVKETYDRIGEGVGFLKVSGKDAPLLRRILGEWVGQGKEYADYEEVIDAFLQEAVVGYELVGGLAWTEIDFPEDLEKAEKQVLSRI
jgi:choline kinase